MLASLLSLMLLAPPRVYGHLVPWFPPDHSRPDHAVDVAGGLAGQVRAAAAAGLDGFAIDLVLRPPVRTANILRNYLEAARSVEGFTIAPCLDNAATKDPAEWVALLAAWHEAAGGSPHQMTFDDRPVVFTYAAQGLGAAGWQQVREGCRAAGFEICLIADVGSLCRLQGERARPVLAELAGVADGLYCFSPYPEAQAWLDDACRGLERLRVYSVSPGYWRTDNGAFSRPYRGTESYRESWQQARDFGVDWVSITTWNDYGENTQIEPSRNLSDLYARLTAQEARQFKGQPTPAEPETWWVTCPAELPDGPGDAPLEPELRRERWFGLTRLGGDASAPAELTITTPTGEVLQRWSAPDATALWRWEPAGTLGLPFVVVTARAGDRSARVPVPLWPRDIARRFHLAPLHTKLTAAVAPSPTVAVNDGRLVVEPLEPATGRVDLLHDHWPMPDPRSTTGRIAAGAAQLPADPPTWGFWTAARVDPDAVTRWAEPLWVPPDGDPLVLLDYPLQQDAQDRSIYRRHGRVQGADAGFVDDGQGGRGFVSHEAAWIQPPGSYLPVRVPVRITLDVLPQSADGMIFGDVGAALLLSLKDLHPVVSRHRTEPASWHSATGPTPLTIGVWATLSALFDGEQLRLFVNGEEVATTTCPGPSGSQRQALGRNPYDGSSVFQGLLRNLRIVAGERALAGGEVGAE